VHSIAIGAQIATPENLQDMKSIGFSNTDSEDAMIFRSMAGIEIPTTVVMNQISCEGKCKLI